MIATTPLHIIYTRTYDNKPLVSLQGGPFNDFDITPDQLRTLAAALMTIADTSESFPAAGRYWREHRAQMLWPTRSGPSVAEDPTDAHPSLGEPGLPAKELRAFFSRSREGC